jgi:hypothetical protein
MRTLHDTIDLAVEVGPPVEAGPLRLFPLFVTAPAAPAYVAGPEADAAEAIAVTEHDGGAAVPELVLTSGATARLKTTRRKLMVRDMLRLLGLAPTRRRRSCPPADAPTNAPNYPE